MQRINLVRRHFTSNLDKILGISQIKNFSTSSKNSFYEDQESLLQEQALYHKKNFDNKQAETRSLDYQSSQFSHLSQITHEPKQVDISEKPKNKKSRIACASGYIQLNETTFKALIHNELKKGNALIVAEIAGIQSSKLTSQLIPLCHQVLLDVCDVTFKCDAETFRIYCEAICKTSMSKTGVEMEALTACSVALLTVYDMCKAVQKNACINGIKLDYKYGGKSDYNRLE
jgi:molybdenum cofactor biosynthesis protein MoaC